MAALLDGIVGWFQHLGPVVEKTVFLKMPGIDPLLAPLGDQLGFELGMLKVGRFDRILLCWGLRYFAGRVCEEKRDTQQVEAAAEREGRLIGHVMT